MATLYIQEHSSVNMHEAPMPALPSVADQAVTISGTSAQSSALNSKTKYVLLCTDTACHIRAGSNPTAVTTDFLLPANVIVPYTVQGGDKIAAIT